MSELDSIEKIDAARAELARHGVTLESFEVMRERIEALEKSLIECLEFVESDYRGTKNKDLTGGAMTRAYALLEGE